MKEIQETKRNYTPVERNPWSTELVASLQSNRDVISQIQHRNPVTSDILNDVELYDSSAGFADSTLESARILRELNQPGS